MHLWNALQPVANGSYFQLNKIFFFSRILIWSKVCTVLCNLCRRGITLPLSRVKLGEEVSHQSIRLNRYLAVDFPDVTRVVPLYAAIILVCELISLLWTRVDRTRLLGLRSLMALEMKQDIRK